MKKFVKRVVLLLVTLLVLAVAVPFLIPMESYKAEIIRSVKDTTGRDLAIAGPMHLTLFPGIGLHLDRVTLSNPRGYSSPAMLSVESATVHVAFMPLLSRRVEVTELSLDKPVIDLEVDAEGVPNWRFTPPDQVPESPTRHSGGLQLLASAEAAEPAPAPAASGSALDLLRRLQLGNVSISDGMLNYTNMLTRKSYALSAINLHLSMKGPNVPFTLSGDTQFNGQKTALDVKVDTPETLLSGSGAAVHFSINAQPVQLGLDVRISTLAADGDLQLNVASLPGLFAWVNGIPNASEASTPLALSVKSKLNCNPAQCVADNAEIKLDNITLTGKAGVTWQGKLPYIVAGLHADAFDFTPYMAGSPQKQDGHASPAAEAKAAHAPAGANGWSTVPIDVSGLKVLNADIQLSAGKVVAGQVKLGQTSLTAALKDGMLHLAVPSVALYGGQGEADIRLDGRYAAPELNVKASLAGVQAEPLLKDAENFDRLSGTANFTLSVTGHGANERDIIDSLNGDGKFSFTNGAFKGVDLADMAQNIKGLVSGNKAAPSGSQETKFSAITGTYTIALGVVHNGDLLMQSSLVQLKGAGDADLPKRYVNYRFEPQVGSKNNPGVGVPVIAQGPFGNVTFRPDLSAAAKNVIANPDAIKNTAKSVRDQIRHSGGINNLLKSLGN